MYGVNRRGRPAGVLRHAQSRTAEYIYGATQWEPSLPYPGQNEFLDAYRKEFGHDPSYHSAAGYAGCVVYAEGVKARRQGLDSDKVREALLKLETRTMFGDYKVDADGFPAGAQDGAVPVAGRQEAHRLAGRARRRGRRGSRHLPGPSARRLARRAPEPVAVNVTITPAMLGQVVVSGILAGALYAMVALGLALIFGADARHQHRARAAPACWAPTRRSSSTRRSG